ncbi:piggyBac transposable element-derived protein 4-like [Ptychodera flava]|uniref:piggyBac transposable element-derived protein 4-like n=1 Tax=Ptychodera flava TaxID=63121 RepID=UPI00396A38D4
MAATGPDFGRLRNLPPEIHEIFNDEDSREEFLGFSDVNDDSDDDFDAENAQGWQQVNADHQRRQPPPFTGNPGFQVDVSADPSFLDFVFLMIPADSFDVMSLQTNKYARDYLSGTQLLPHSRFVGAVLAMGLVIHEDISDYWSTDLVLATPFFPSIMSRDRFLNVLLFFHLANNDNYIPRGRDGYDPLFKLGAVYRNIVRNFRDVWQPNKNICVDEGMVPFRGNIHFKVHNPDKQDKYGFKAYEVCDSSNGYCCKFELYTVRSDETTSGKGKTYDLVMGLMDGYLRKGHVLYVDNYYTSPILFYDLYKEDTLACGTSRHRKGIPARIKETKLKEKGEKLVMVKGPLMVMKYKDRKDVVMLSTIHSAKNIDLGDL